jgi:hypothetical protein
MEFNGHVCNVNTHKHFIKKSVCKHRTYLSPYKIRSACILSLITNLYVNTGHISIQNSICLYSITDYKSVCKHRTYLHIKFDLPAFYQWNLKLNHAFGLTMMFSIFHSADSPLCTNTGQNFFGHWGSTSVNISWCCNPVTVMKVSTPTW